MSEHVLNDEHEVTGAEDRADAEPAQPDQKPLSRREIVDRWTEVVSTVLLAAVAVAAAWSGYQSTRWSGEQADNYIQASGTRVESNRAATLAGQERLYDLTMFNNWLNAYSAHQTKLADIYEKRFRDEFRPFFKAWLATDPFNNPNAPAGPLLMPEYHLQQNDTADKLEKAATNFLEAGRAANEIGDEYVLVTVFLAVVLFFVAIAQRFQWDLIQWIVLGIACVMLVIGLARLATLPIN